MGTPEFSVPCLETLVKDGHEVCGVFTQPDKARGRRGNKLVPSPVKAKAVEYGFEVYQPVSLRKGDDAVKVLEVLKKISPDVIVVTAYGQILPKEILELPRYGCINIHASLLPKYRGAAPINWVLLNGETETGVTSMQMSEGLDTGDMLVKRNTPIGENEIYEELYSRLSKMGGEVLTETLKAIQDGSLTPEKQDDSLSCYSPMITKDMSRLDFSETAQQVHNTIRGVTGYTTLDGKRLKIYRSEISSGVFEAQHGTVVYVDSEKFSVVCGDGKAVTFTEVQLEGSRRMNTGDFLRGKKLEKGMSFSD